MALTIPNFPFSGFYYRFQWEEWDASQKLNYNGFSLDVPIFVSDHPDNVNNAIQDFTAVMHYGQSSSVNATGSVRVRRNSGGQPALEVAQYWHEPNVSLTQGYVVFDLGSVISNSECSRVPGR